MALVTTKEMFKKAYAGGYAIGAFNINNMEIIQAITEAAQVLLCGLSATKQAAMPARMFATNIFTMYALKFPFTTKV